MLPPEPPSETRMDQMTDFQHPNRPPAHPSLGAKLSTLISWIVIGLMVVILVVGNLLPEPTPSDETAVDSIGLQMMELNSRILIGQNQFRPVPGNQIEALYTGTIPQRLRFVAVAGELDGPASALEYLDDLETRITERDDITFSETETALATALRALYDDYAADLWDAPSLDDAQRALITTELGWFGELALAPRDGPAADERQSALAPALRTFWTMISAAGAGIGAGLLGLAGLVVLIIFMFLKRLPNRIGGRLPRGHIYAETFALWMLLLFALGYGAGLLHFPQSSILLVSMVAAFLSLLALLWPIVRGIAWSDVRRDIGWHTDDRLLVNIGAGFAGYAMALPLIGVGLLATLVLMWFSGALMGGEIKAAEYFGPTGGPAHPIIKYFSEPGVWPRVQILLIASVAAPIVEETMYRGVLYRHLRSATAGWGVAGSIIVSTGVNSLLFASIHPQGWIAVPVLGALAAAMTLAREWRGSIIPSMIIHGTSNGIVMTLFMLLLSG